MADLLGMDAARIERLRSPERLEYFDPAKLWQALEPAANCILIDIGAGVGFITLHFAAAYPQATVHGCDILSGMVGLLRQDADDKGLDNLQTHLMGPAAIDLPYRSADIIVMAQVHHELDDPPSLLAECHRLTAQGGMIVIADWKDEDNGKSPPGGRRVSATTITQHLEGAGFGQIQSHDIYEFHNVITGRA